MHKTTGTILAIGIVGGGVVAMTIIAMIAAKRQPLSDEL
jgi:hypothetical protein